MITYHDGNLLLDDAEILVNPVNCIGILGAGLARQFRVRYPGLAEPYREACDTGALQLGRCWSWQAPDHIVCCFPTKRVWRDRSEIEWIVDALKDLRQRLVAKPRSIALPMLGCGLGGLEWPDVRAWIEDILGDLPCDIRIYGLRAD